MNALHEDKEGLRGKIILDAEHLSPTGSRRPGAAETLFAVSKAVGSHLGLVEVLRQTTRALVRALGADVGSVWRVDVSEGSFVPLAGYRVPPQALDTMFKSTALSAHTLVRELCNYGRAVHSSDSAGDPRFDYPLLRLVPHRSMLIQPLHVRGQTAGVFVFIWTRARHRFNQVQLRLVEAVTQQAATAIENAELMDEVRLFTERLEMLVRDRTGRLRRAYKELRASREELRALSTHLERIREDERTRISREIHDELGQALTGLKIDLVHLFADANAHRDGGSRRLTVAIDEMIAAVRRIASELRPQILDDLGLLATIEWQTQEFQTRTGIPCSFRCKGEADSINVEQTTALFRIFQEMLTNIARHAEATRVQITLDIGQTFVRLDVRDNGRGMSRTPVDSRRPHLGLLGMRERANVLGGRVVISAVSPHGTRVRVRLPRRISACGSGGNTHGGRRAHHRL
jgi:signal transduction histidine kinase